MSEAELKQNLAHISESVQPIIDELLSKDVESKNIDVMLYQCGVGGKRIRPAMVILSGQIFNANFDDMLYPAASIEILHNATLIIDDIIDHSEFRRDQPTCWSKYGTSIAQCASFTYISSVFSGLANANNGSKLIDLYSKTLKIIVDGEIKDIVFERSGREDENYVVKNRYQTITKDDYFEMIGQKTAVLLRTCCQAGAICADATEEQVELIGDFGFNLGMAFQIRDDVLDIFGDEKEIGKKVGKDIIEKKMGNFIVLTAIDLLSQPDRDTVVNFLEGDKEISDQDAANITDLIDKTDARNIAETTANSFITKAFESLEKLPQNEYKNQLSDIANYIVSRKK